MFHLDETSPTIPQPKGLKIKLRPHQLTSIAAMRSLERDSTVIIDTPDETSKIWQTVRGRVHDMDEANNSTFIIKTNSAILADKVGSGKTFMILGLILSQNTPEAHNRHILGTDYFSIEMINARETEKVNLIVVPHNLAEQWGKFCDKSNVRYLKLNTNSDFNVFFDIDYVDKQEFKAGQPMTLYSVTKKKKALTKCGGNSKTNKKSDIIYERKILNIVKVRNILKSYNIFILNVNRYRFFKQIFFNKQWSRVIIDEMDSANIPTTFDEFGNFNWFVTATPTSIFYKSCRRYVNKIFGYNQNLLDYFVVKNKDSYVDSAMALPPPHVFVIPTMLQRVVNAIKDLIPQDVLQMINAGNMKEAVVKLNCDIDTEENIVKVLTDKIKVDIHNLKEELAYTQRIKPRDAADNEKKIKRIEEELKRLKAKLALIKDRVDSIKKECCFICADNFDTPTILDCCKSVFCFKCLIQALKTADNKCPYCRHVIKSHKEYHVISTKPEKQVQKPTNKSTGKKFGDMEKTDALEYMLTYIAKNDQNPRILIFSDFTQTFDKIINNIANAKLKYALLSGIPAHINNVIAQFEQGDINILMLDSKHYGSGLNLQCARYLILFHRMLPELETQVIGRAHRFGRKESLRVIYLVNDSESEASVLSKNPIKLFDTEELLMLTNPPVLNTDGYEENIEEVVEIDENDNIEEEIPHPAPDLVGPVPMNFEEIEQLIDDNMPIYKKKSKKKSKEKSKNKYLSDEDDDIII